MTLEHLVRAPAPARSHPPLLLLLHGLGSDERDLFALAPWLDRRFLVVSARAPYAMTPSGFAWYVLDRSATPTTLDPAEVEASREALAEAVPELCGAYGADPARVFLFGFSQGAVMSYALALARPELVRGLVAHSGRVLPQSLSRAAPAPALARLEALVLHGRDDAVIPVERGREARALLAPLLGTRVEYREYPIGHTISEESLADANAWLAARAGE
ncbi:MULTISPECIES: alpha/beta hydrolase [Anaeromyxobacter]|uniref:alpha/beta hydrolase n=1 Tax=Anaeromyxobacter TaxID=161492 RepID=UPI001F58ADB9|nr:MULTISPECIES: alpha/beta fold hydrolase [unclassified Anaeromyxobacter]